jgi:glutamate racemase
MKTIYLADSKNAPYGQNLKEIVALSIKNTDLLLEKCKLIVVACNTATNAIRELRAKYDIPFIGIEPAIKPAATNSKQEKLAF